MRVWAFRRAWKGRKANSENLGPSLQSLGGEEASSDGEVQIERQLRLHGM